MSQIFQMHAVVGFGMIGEWNYVKKNIKKKKKGEEEIISIVYNHN